MCVLHNYNAILLSTENHAPTVSGPVVLYVTSGVRIEETYTVSDADDHDIVTLDLVEVSKH